MFRPAGSLAVVLCWVIAGLMVPGTASAADPLPDRTTSRPDWRADLEMLGRELPQRHKHLFFQTERAVFAERLMALERALPDLDDARVALRIHELILAMGDDHSGALWLQWPALPVQDTLPLSLYWFADGWRVLAAPTGREALLGQKLVAVNGTPIAEVEAALARWISPHAAVVKSRLPNLLVQPVVLRAGGFLRGDRTDVALLCEDEAGRRQEAILSPVRAAPGGLASFRPAVVPLGWRDQRTILWSTLLAEPRIFYLQYNRCDGREVAERRGDRAAAAKLPSLQALFATARAELEAALASGSADTLVFDLRHNSGGASDFGTRFLEGLAKLPALRERGRVFVILGRRTYSSAILNARDCIRLLGATPVGERTGGTANHYGEVKTFVLPSSRLPIAYSTKYFGAAGGRLEPLGPELPAEMSFADYRDGRDRPVAAIIDARTRRAAK